MNGHQGFRRLLEPAYIGKVRTRNRMIKTGAGTSFIEKDGRVGEAIKDFYEALARGGVGLIIVESCGVEYPLGVHHIPVHLHLEDDRYIPGYGELADVIHRHGCPAFLQLFHSGPWHPRAVTGLTPVSSSALSPEERDIRMVRKGSLTEQDVVAIYRRIDDFSAENKVLLARELKAYWSAQGKWEKKACSNKQWEKVRNVKSILGEE